MSLGGGKSLALDEAVDAAVEDGLHFAVAVGYLSPMIIFPHKNTPTDVHFAFSQFKGWK